MIGSKLYKLVIIAGIGMAGYVYTFNFDDFFATELTT